MIFYSVDQNGIYRKHDDVDPTPTVANTIQVVFPNTAEYDEMQLWGQTNGSWVYFPDAPLAGSALDSVRITAKVAIANGVDTIVSEILTKKGIGRTEMFGFGSRIRHSLANTDVVPIALPANCSIIKDSLVSGVSCADLMNSTIAFDSAFDSFMGTIAGYRRIAIESIEGSIDQSSIDVAYSTFMVSVQIYLDSNPLNVTF